MISITNLIGIGEITSEIDLQSRVLQLYLKQTDPNIPPAINIAPGLSKEEFIDIDAVQF